MIFTVWYSKLIYRFGVCDGFLSRVADLVSYFTFRGKVRLLARVFEVQSTEHVFLAEKYVFFHRQISMSLSRCQLHVIS